MTCPNCGSKTFCDCQLGPAGASVPTWHCPTCKGNSGDIRWTGICSDCGFDYGPDSRKAGPAADPIARKPSNPKDLIGSDKLPLDLVPGTTKAYLTLGHLEGHLKYGLVNWREAGVRTSIYLGALERHVEKFKGGEWEDPTTGVPHLANAITCLSILIDAFETGQLTDDRPKSAPVAALIDRFAAKVVHLKKLFGSSKPIDYFISGPKKRT